MTFVIQIDRVDGLSIGWTSTRKDGHRHVGHVRQIEGHAPVVEAPSVGWPICCPGLPGVIKSALRDSDRA